MAERLNATKFILECTALRRVIQEDGLSEKEQQAIHALLLNLLTEMDRRKKPKQQCRPPTQ